MAITNLIRCARAILILVAVSLLATTAAAQTNRPAIVRPPVQLHGLDLDLPATEILAGIEASAPNRYWRVSGAPGRVCYEGGYPDGILCVDTAGGRLVTAEKLQVLGSMPRDDALVRFERYETALRLSEGFSAARRRSSDYRSWQGDGAGGQPEGWIAETVLIPFPGTGSYAILSRWCDGPCDPPVAGIGIEIANQTRWLGLHAGMTVAEATHSLDLPPGWHERCPPSTGSDGIRHCSISGKQTRFATSDLRFSLFFHEESGTVQTIFATWNFHTDEVSVRSMFGRVVEGWDRVVPLETLPGAGQYDTCSLGAGRRFRAYSMEVRVACGTASKRELVVQMQLFDVSP